MSNQQPWGGVPHPQAPQAPQAWPQPPVAPPPPAKRASRWWIWVLAALGASFSACIGGLMYIGAVGPETHAVPGPQVTASQLQTLRDIGALQPGEELRYFFSPAMTDIKNGVYIVTDRKVAAYNVEWPDKLVVARYEELEKVELTRDTWPDESKIHVTKKGGAVFDLLVAGEGDGDVRFDEALRAAWKARVPDRPEPRP